MPVERHPVPSTEERMFPIPEVGRRFRTHRTPDGADGAAENTGADMATTPTTTVTVTVPLSLDLAAEMSTVARGASPELARLNTQLARAIVRDHEDDPLARLEAATIALNSAATSG